MRSIVTNGVMEYASIRRRFGTDQGIAIGPILFVVAILAVLVGAIAAGSGGFSSSTGAQTSKILASTIIEQGNNLKTAVDNLTVNGVAVASVTADASATTGLFAATGGGIAPQTAPAAARYASGADWAFVKNATVPNVGSAAKNYVATLEVSQAVCQAIAQTLTGSTTLEQVSGGWSDVGNIMTSMNWTAWQSGSTAARMQGCAQSGLVYIYFQVLAIG